MPRRARVSALVFVLATAFIGVGCGGEDDECAGAGEQAMVVQETSIMRMSAISAVPRVGRVEAGVVDGTFLDRREWAWEVTARLDAGVLQPPSLPQL